MNVVGDAEPPPSPAPNTPIQPTPLRGRKIGAILKSGLGSKAFPIYRGGAADGHRSAAHQFFIPSLAHCSDIILYNHSAFAQHLDRSQRSTSSYE